MTQATTSAWGWLLITVSTAGAPPALRVQVWRRLRALGALYLQQSVCLLPDRPEVTRAVRRLLDRVHRDGGQGRLLKVALTDPAEEHAVIEDFRRERGVEYVDLLERIPEFLAELDRERARGRTTYAEVEESEADLHRFQSWLAKIAARDYFDAPGATEARPPLRAAPRSWLPLRKTPWPPRPPNPPQPPSLASDICTSPTPPTWTPDTHRHRSDRSRTSQGHPTMPSHQPGFSACPRPTAQLPELGPWHGGKDPQTGSRDRGWTRRSCSLAPDRRRSSWRSDCPRPVLAAERFLR